MASPSRIPLNSSTGSQDERDVTRITHFNNRATNDQLIEEKGYCQTNAVTTSRYTKLNFVPKNLIEFFSIVANVYFLLISVLQLTSYNPDSNKFTTSGPLLVIFCLTMLKQGLEDFKRHKADHVMNSRNVSVLRNNALTSMPWEDVRTGDILRVRFGALSPSHPQFGDREEVAADIILLATSEEEGRCFTETSNLDGETNLKRRGAVSLTAEFAGLRPVGGAALDEMQVRGRLCQMKGFMEHETPNNRLYNFTGRVQLSNGQVAPVDPANVILRGCVMRSCKYVYGFVVFTGPETKIMQNARSAPTKRSNVYKKVNQCIGLIFCTLVAMCLISGVMYGLWTNSNEGKLWYMGSIFDTASFSGVLGSLLTFIILYNNLVPISLYVSMDFIKVLQAAYINNDKTMYDKDSDTYALARTSDLNEDLGQIEYIFSDKTGTLTRNLMEFRKCSIGGVAYGFGTTEIGRAAAQRGGANQATAEPSHLSNPRLAQVNYDPTINFDDPRMMDTLEAGGPQGALVEDFLALLATCHTVIPELDNTTGELAYRAASPDEEALVKAAKCLGYDVRTAAPRVQVNVKRRNGAGEVRQYEVLNVNEFNSTRKRMSSIVRTPTGEIVLYCKGADNVMFERSIEDPGKPLLIQHLTRFASEGLRTLVLSRKVLDPGYYAQWNARYLQAAASMSNREENLMAIAEEIEQQMTVVGATAIEDKLQVGVPTAISNLADAGIKVWVLTGDKEETAINIGYACQLLTQEMKLIFVNKSSEGELREQLRGLMEMPVINELVRKEQVSDELALVIDGKSLLQVFADGAAGEPSVKDPTGRTPSLAGQLLRIAKVCKAVVACRVSPAQKAQVVKLVKENVQPAPMTLAIGDGANDVNMIQTAHVGIGISGQEGVQAVNSSDYAISQFRFLEQLLLVHGRSNYSRITRVILYSFYKNIALVFSLFLFNFFNGYSGTTLYESIVKVGWNLFLAAPIVMIGIFDTDVSERNMKKNPILYKPGPINMHFNALKFLFWIANAVLHALIVFFIPMGVAYSVGWDADGLDDGMTLVGTSVYGCLLITVQLKVALLTRSWNWLNQVFYWGSTALFFLFVMMYTAISPTSLFYYVGFELYARAMFWMLMLMVPVACMFIDYAMTSYMRLYDPMPGDVLLEREKGMQNKYSLPQDSKDKLPSRRVSTLRDTFQPAPSVQNVIGGKPMDRRTGIRDMQKAPSLGFDFSYPVWESQHAMIARQTASSSSRGRVKGPAIGQKAGAQPGGQIALKGGRKELPFC